MNESVLETLRYYGDLKHLVSKKLMVEIYDEIFRMVQIQKMQLLQFLGLHFFLKKETDIRQEGWMYVSISERL